MDRIYEIYWIIVKQKEMREILWWPKSWLPQGYIFSTFNVGTCSFYYDWFKCKLCWDCALFSCVNRKQSNKPHFVSATIVWNYIWVKIRPNLYFPADYKPITHNKHFTTFFFSFTFTRNHSTISWMSLSLEKPTESQNFHWKQNNCLNCSAGLWSCEWMARLSLPICLGTNHHCTDTTTVQSWSNWCKYY